jgi:hypothetical protein
VQFGPSCMRREGVGVRCCQGRVRQVWRATGTEVWDTLWTREWIFSTLAPAVVSRSSYPPQPAHPPNPRSQPKLQTMAPPFLPSPSPASLRSLPTLLPPSPPPCAPSHPAPIMPPSPAPHPPTLPSPAPLLPPLQPSPPPSPRHDVAQVAVVGGHGVHPVIQVRLGHTARGEEGGGGRGLEWGTLQRGRGGGGGGGVCVWWRGGRRRRGKGGGWRGHTDSGQVDCPAAHLGTSACTHAVKAHHPPVNAGRQMASSPPPAHVPR